MVIGIQVQVSRWRYRAGIFPPGYFTKKIVNRGAEYINPVISINIGGVDRTSSYKITVNNVLCKILISIVFPTDYSMYIIVIICSAQDINITVIIDVRSID